MDELRPLPEPPRCRGIPIGDSYYSGCAYGHGDWEPFTGPCDCPTCEGSGIEGGTGTTIPHSEFGGAGCDGCLYGRLRGDEIDIKCNACGAVVRTVPVADFERLIGELEMQLDFDRPKCPHCGAVNILPGFHRLFEFHVPELRQSGKSSGQ